MLKTVFHMNLFTKYLVSYVIIFLIPTFILMMTVNNSYMRILKNEYVRSSIDTMNQLKDNLDTKITSMQKTAFQVSENPGFSSYTSDISSLGPSKMVDTLKNYIIPMDYIQEVIFYRAGDNILYSSSGTYTLETFADFIYKYKDMDSQKFKVFLSDLYVPYFKGAEQINVMQSMPCRIMTYFVPVNIVHGRAQNYIFYIIDESAIKKHMQSAFGYSNGNVLILNKERLPLASLHNENIPEDTDIKKILSDDRYQYMVPIKLQNQEYYYATVVRSPMTGWYFISIIPENKITQPIEQQAKVTYYSLIAIVLLGGIAIYIVMSINYGPIRLIKKMIDEFYGGEKQRGNEIDLFKTVVSNITSSNTTLQHKLKKSLPAIRESLLKGLLKGKFLSIEEFNAEAMEAGITITKSFYAVAVVYFPISINKFAGSFSGHLKDFNTHCIEMYSFEGINDNTLIMILASDYTDSDELLGPLQLLQRRLDELTNMETSIGIGRWYQYVKDIGKSFLEASACLDYRPAKGGTILFFHDIDASQLNLKEYPKEELVEIELAMLQQNPVKIINASDKIIAYAKSNNSPLFVAKLLYFDIINTAFKTLHVLKTSGCPPYINYPEIPALAGFADVDQLFEMLKDLCDNICRNIEAMSSKKSTEKINEIREYIQKNHTSPELCAQNIADFFQLSVSSLSHYFKDRVGESVSDYICHNRIETAKKLLVETEDPLNTISVKVGYWHSTSFIRVFKSRTGLTPGEYRKRYYLA